MENIFTSDWHIHTEASYDATLPYEELITRAKELLSTTAMRTGDVAYAVGYNDPHYFSYLFKKNTGLSPRDYRKDEKTGK